MMRWVKIDIQKGVNWVWKHGAVIVIIALLGAGTYKEIYLKGLTMSNGFGSTKRVTAIVDSVSTTPLTNLITEFYLTEALTGLELGSGNTMEVYNVRDYGAVPNVTVPASGSTVAGTDQAAAFSAAFSAAPAGAIVFAGVGNWGIFTPIATFTTKRVFFIGLGNFYTNGGNFMTLGPAGGQDRGHYIVIPGKIIGRVNMPANNTTTRANGTSPQWSTFTGTGITLLTNVNNSYVRVNWIEGFRVAYEIQAGSGGGCQENTFEFRRLDKNGTGVRFRHVNATGGWIDKNWVHGWGGGEGRISGGLAFEFDGNSGTAANGEVYNGAGRSNSIRFLAELIDSIARIYGDFTYNTIDITPEGGVNTGIFAQQNAIECRSITPNPVFHTRWVWRGVFAPRYMDDGMGLGGTLEGDVWNVATFIGNRGRIDNSGNLIMYVEPTLSLSARNALPANIKCVNLEIEKVRKTIAQPTYTTVAADAEGVLLLNNNPMVLTPGPASSNVDVTIRLKNINAANATLFNVSGKSTLAENEEVDISSDGITWIALSTGTSYTPAP